MKTRGNELKILGQDIRRRRHLLKISQDELAHRSGLHRTYVTDVEQGNRNLTFFSLVALARGLGVTVSELTAGVGPFKGEERQGGTGGHFQSVNYKFSFPKGQDMMLFQ